MPTIFEPSFIDMLYYIFSYYLLLFLASPKFDSLTKVRDFLLLLLFSQGLSCNSPNQLAHDLGNHFIKVV